MTRVKLERRQGHVVAARKQGMALSHYAREHGISRYTLYAAQRQLRSEEEVKAKRLVCRARRRPTASPFVAVQRNRARNRSSASLRASPCRGADCRTRSTPAQTPPAAATARQSPPARSRSCGNRPGRDARTPRALGSVGTWQRGQHPHQRRACGAVEMTELEFYTVAQAGPYRGRR